MFGNRLFGEVPTKQSEVQFIDDLLFIGSPLLEEYKYVIQMHCEMC